MRGICAAGCKDNLARLHDSVLLAKHDDTQRSDANDLYVCPCSLAHLANVQQLQIAEAQLAAWLGEEANVSCIGIARVALGHP